MAQQAAQTKTRQAETRGRTERVALGIDAAAVKSDVHLDQHVERASGTGHRVGPPSCNIQVIDDDRDRRPVGEGEDAARV
jgi:hypothetical protein